ncbi:hypothetical protein CC80DRAFT_566180 [Byssothecium circinans]|uniref:Uncharacterized protein n=1 Tax=Byssothecium circinans TaxID=147558 RepID=A0A6A5U1C3_9PLEO|nr:hypothetical protein CC80DRAFT_566180 [Byssothecium circinans]
MAQGAVKKSKPTSKKYFPPPLPFPLPFPLPHIPLTNTLPRPSQKVQRGSRIIKPKKASLISQNKIKHKSTAGLTGKTEKMLAAKAGHLEMLKGGKREKRIEKEGVKKA